MPKRSRRSFSWGTDQFRNAGSIMKLADEITAWRVFPAAESRARRYRSTEPPDWRDDGSLSSSNITFLKAPSCTGKDQRYWRTLEEFRSAPSSRPPALGTDLAGPLSARTPERQEDLIQSFGRKRTFPSSSTPICRACWVRNRTRGLGMRSSTMPFNGLRLQILRWTCIDS